MNKTIQIQVPEGKTNLVEVDKVDNRPVTERIKTFEDAVKATGMKLPFDDNQLSCLPKDVVAYMKLRIIAASLNGLTEDTLDEFPKLTSDEYRYYPWFYLKMDEENKKTIWLFCGGSEGGSEGGLAAADSRYAWSYSVSNLSARLAYYGEVNKVSAARLAELLA